jgi:hypothetical protein
MNETQSNLIIDSDTGNLVMDDVEENRRADEAAGEVFGGSENAEKTGALITRFVASYEQHKHKQPLEEWLTEEFRRYPAIWKDENEIVVTAREIIQSVQEANASKESLYAHLDAGKSRESWLADRIEQGAAAAGVTQVGDYAARIDEALLEASLEADITSFRYDAIDDDFIAKANPNLHGFIAEADLASQFNIDATTRGSGYRAEVLGSNAADSVDLLIRDAAGRVVDNIQVKSYADVDYAINNIRAHNYPRGTVLMVHKNQIARLQREFPDLKVVSRYEQDGAKLDMPSYAKLKQLQRRAQLRQEAQQYAWNDVNRINVAKQIGRQALIGACITAGLHGARILGRRIWNKMIGKENPPASEDLKDFFQSSLKSAKHIGVQVAVSGAVVVAARNGLIKVLQHTPAGQIANMVYVGLENAKVLLKFAQGEINGLEALDAMGNVTCCVVGGLWGAGIGMSNGALIGSVFGPVGMAIGGFVGAVVGGMAGSTIGEAVYNGAKAIAKTAAQVVKSAWEGTKEAVKIVGRVLNPVNWFA